MRIERWLLYLKQFDYLLKYNPVNRTQQNISLPLTESDIQPNEARKQVVHSIATDSALIQYRSGLYIGSNEEGPGSQEAHSTHSGLQSSPFQI